MDLLMGDLMMVMKDAKETSFVEVTIVVSLGSTSILKTIAVTCLQPLLQRNLLLSSSLGCPLSLLQVRGAQGVTTHLVGDAVHLRILVTRGRVTVMDRWTGD